MEKYIGTKVLTAVAMTLGDYNKKRGWTLPDNEDPNREGYLVEYPDGYVSWSPKEVFEESYRKTDGMNFGLAIEAVKSGKLIARNGWNGKGMFVFLRPSDTLPVDMIVDKVKSLPDSLKTYYKARFSHNSIEEKAGKGPQSESVHFTSYLCMKAADGSIVNGWLASQTDMLAEDWVIIE